MSTRKRLTTTLVLAASAAALTAALYVQAAPAWAGVVEVPAKSAPPPATKSAPPPASAGAPEKKSGSRPVTRRRAKVVEGY